VTLPPGAEPARRSGSVGDRGRAPLGPSAVRRRRRRRAARTRASSAPNVFTIFKPDPRRRRRPSPWRSASGRNSLFLAILVGNAADRGRCKEVPREGARARPTDGARRARAADGRTRRNCAERGGGGGRRRRPRSHRSGRSGRRGRDARAGRVAARRRVDPHGRVERCRAVSGRRGAVGGRFAVEGAGGVRPSRRSASRATPPAFTGEARTFRHSRSPLEARAEQPAPPAGGSDGAARSPCSAMRLWHRDAPLHTAVADDGCSGGPRSSPKGSSCSSASRTPSPPLAHGAPAARSYSSSNAIESIASVDVVCLDKTGTLTESALRVVEIVGSRCAEQRARPATPRPRRRGTRPWRRIAAAYPRRACAGRGGRCRSRRGGRFGAQRIGGVGYVLGAPEHFEVERPRRGSQACGGAKGGACSRSGTADVLESDRPESARPRAARRALAARGARDGSPGSGARGST